MWTKEVRIAVIDWFNERTGKYPVVIQEENPTQFKLLLAQFIHESENMLRDLYGCDD